MTPTPGAERVEEIRKDYAHPFDPDNVHQPKVYEQHVRDLLTRLRAVEGERDDALAAMNTYRTGMLREGQGHHQAEQRLKAVEAERAETAVKLRGAERLGEEVAALVRRGILDSRSGAADALLDFQEPPVTPRADRIIALEEQVASLRTALLKEHHQYQHDYVKDEKRCLTCHLLAATLRGGVKR